MKFDEHVNSMIRDIEVPDELMPDNIALMLKSKTAEKNKKPSISVKSQKKAIIYRTVSAAAACAVLVLGVTVMMNTDSEGISAGYIEDAGQVKTAENYSVIYKAFRNSVINNSDIKREPTKDVTEIKPENTQPSAMPPEPVQKPGDDTDDKVTEYKMSTDSQDINNKADIIKTDGENIYYIANNALYAVKKNGGNISLLSKIYDSRYVPVEMYIDGDRLIVISSTVDEVPYEVHTKESVSVAETSGVQETSGEITDTVSDETSPIQSETSAQETSAQTEPAPVSLSDSENVPSAIQQSNTVAEIFDISDKNAPKSINVYKQNGSYISSAMSGGFVYIVTNYSDFQSKPLERENDLDNYIPSYSLNGSKYYVEANDIFIPHTVSATGYTVASGLDMNAENPVVSVKAVIGSGSYVASYDNDMYVVGSFCGEKNKTASSIIRFTYENGNLAYKSSAAVEGTLVSSSSMNKYEDTFRIAAKVSDQKSKKSHINIYIFDENLNSLGSISDLAQNADVTRVKFSENTALIGIKDSDTPIEVDLSDRVSPKAVAEATVKSKMAYLNKIGDNYFGIGTVYDEEGKSTDTTKITLFDSALNELSSLDINGNISGIFTNRILNKNKILIDPQKGIIGIPTVKNGDYGIKNYYNIFTVSENTIQKKCVLDYSEISETLAFNRAVIDGNILYVFSNSRIVSYNLDELKVIDTILIK